jgi:hypothetical protein
MDPNACLRRIFDASTHGTDPNPDEAREAMRDLFAWLYRGGFAPTNTRAVLVRPDGSPIPILVAGPYSIRLDRAGRYVIVRGDHRGEIERFPLEYETPTPPTTILAK